MSQYIKSTVLLLLQCVAGPSLLIKSPGSYCPKLSSSFGIILEGLRFVSLKRAYFLNIQSS